MARVLGTSRRARMGKALLLITFVLGLALSFSEVSAVCLATGKFCGASTTTNDRRCCPGLVCGWGNVCRAGCRIGGSLYQNGAKNPADACESCQPRISTTRWSSLPLDRYYRDDDGDAYGDPSDSILDCAVPSGYVSDSSDCDDHEPTTHPGAAEICGDGIDNDCDGVFGICGATIVIIKRTDVPSLQQFGFSYTDPTAVITPFTLVDDGVNSGEGFDQRSFPGLVTFGQYSVFESGPAFLYELTDIQCTESGAVGTNTPTVIEPADIQARTAPINLDDGETVTCTFTNSAVTCLCPAGPGPAGDAQCHALAVKGCGATCNAAGVCV